MSEVEKVDLIALLDAIQEEVGDLLSIENENLGAEALRQPKIFNRLQKLYSIHVRQLDRMQMRKDVLTNRLKRYYGNKAPDAEYKERPLTVVPLKGEIDEFIKVDEKYLEFMLDLKVQEQIVKYLEDAKRALSDRGYMIKDAIEFRKLTQGTTT